jgi:hypothetical protein
MDWQMKVVIVLLLVLLAAASVVAYSRTEAAGVAVSVLHPSQADESISLLLSGSALIGLAGAVRRLTL